MVHSRPAFEPQEFARIKKHTQWVYVTDDVFRDVKQDNPWDSLPMYLERLFTELEW